MSSHIFCLHSTTPPIIVEFYRYDNLFFKFRGTSTIELIFLYNIISNFS